MDAVNRRVFLQCLGSATAAGATAVWASTASGAHSNTSSPSGPADPMGVLVDLTLCVGCRLCEHACKRANGIDPGSLESYEDTSVFQRQRRPGTDAFTVVNAFPDQRTPATPVYAKVNCLHCNRPACVSACIVGALRKQEDGAVTYDAWKCIGCRYCMVACPFQIPAYEYDDAWTPRVRKCTFCLARTTQGQPPACVETCPRDALRYGKRREILELAHQRIREHPARYVDHVFGEHEVGGTSWVYLSGVPFEQAGFLSLGPDAPPALTESIQHGVFKHGIPPLGLFGLLAGMMWYTGRRRAVASAASACTAATLAIPADASQQVLVMAGGQDLAVDESEVAAHHGSPSPPASPGVPDTRPDQVEPDRPTAPIEPHALHDAHPQPQPVTRKLLTPGVWVLLGLAAIGLMAGVRRFLWGLGTGTNLDQQHPWGLWIAIDVACGVALAAGGFTSAFLTHVLHRDRYHAIVRPALLTAMLGYTFVVIGLEADLGRYYNVWHPMFMWQGNSVLFEVGMCVMCYLNVLYLEFAPIACERLIQRSDRFPRLARLAQWFQGKVERVMFLLIILGVCLSCLHQSSLGNLLVIAPSKLHPLWWTPLSSLLFLLSAIAVGFPMVIWESLFAGWSLKLKPEMTVLTPLARFIPWTLGLYLAVKIADMAYRGTYVHLGHWSVQSASWLVEVGVGVALPLALLDWPRVRRSPRLLFAAATLVVAGVVLNRVNVFLIGYRPPYATRTYWPSLGEWAVTIGLVAALMLAYRAIVTYLPVISSHPRAVRHA
jgi:Ni/Fe-hydrogenase subunit HybB-like protein/Fe-S-cluster-containing dehydrogenase component